ncbi:hypothetical protein [Nonomuraea maheshkhaliensis]
MSAVTSFSQQFQKELIARFPARFTALRQARERLLHNAEQLAVQRRSERS